MRNQKGFRLCGNKGFHITFDNGWTVSVQFGPGNYSDNHHANFDAKGPWIAYEVETAAFKGDKWLDATEDSKCPVQGWQSAADVLTLLNRVAALEAE